MNYYNKDIDKIYEELDTDLKGLTDKQLTYNKTIYEPNILEERKKKPKIYKFLNQFKDSMIIILIIVALIMYFYALFYSNDYVDSIIIFVVVFINAIMGFIQEEKAEVTLESLKKFTKVNCKVRRNNKIVVVDSKNIYPGDIIILEAGDKIPADCRIISEINLKIDESPLTGETLPVQKNEDVIDGIVQLQDQSNMLFSGCNVVNGYAEAVVVATGMNTEIGKIATSLDTPYEVVTPLQLKIKEISKKLTLLIFMIIIFIFIYCSFKGYELIETIMLCVSLSVAVIPEGLPAVITITLSTGTSFLAKKKTIVRQMSAVETLGTTDIICSDKTGTITQNKMKVVDTLVYDKKMYDYIMILANDAKISDDTIIGDPTEVCLIEYEKNKEINVNKIIKENKRITSIPFDSDRKMMSSVNQIKDDMYILVKGSLENLIKKCKYIVNDGKEIKLTKKEKEKILSNEYDMTSRALRVLGLAYKKLGNNDEVIEENNLVFVGLVGMIDPERENVKESVKKCKNAGIIPIMITGDSLVTARAIARNVGILSDDSEAVLGEELDKYSDNELKELVKKYRVYARVSPEHKTRIVKAWQANDKVVGMTGDGVNDAPAIKDAHVGIGMGITGTEVTKSVADIILLDDSFSTIVDAVEEGRRIFSNIRNNIVYSLSSNFAELFLILIGMFTNHTILLPIHILFIDLITDTIPSICLSFEKAENNIMNKKPRGINKPIFTPFVNATIIYSAIVETFISLIVFLFALTFYNSEIAMTLALLSIVIQEILYSLTCRNLKDFFFKQGIFSNKATNIGLLSVIIVELIFFLTPVGKIINIVSIRPIMLLVVFMFNLIGLVLYEIGKPVLNKYFKD